LQTVGQPLKKSKKKKSIDMLERKEGNHKILKITKGRKGGRQK
jgi:hypothetical protein